MQQQITRIPRGRFLAVSPRTGNAAAVSPHSDDDTAKERVIWLLVYGRFVEATATARTISNRKTRSSLLRLIKESQTPDQDD